MCVRTQSGLVSTLPSYKFLWFYTLVVGAVLNSLNWRRDPSEVKIKEAILRTPVVKFLQFALIAAAAVLYASSYAAAAHGSQILAAVACVIAVQIVTDETPDKDGSRSSGCGRAISVGGTAGPKNEVNGWPACLDCNGRFRDPSGDTSTTIGIRTSDLECARRSREPAIPESNPHTILDDGFSQRSIRSGKHRSECRDRRDQVKRGR